MMSSYMMRLDFTMDAARFPGSADAIASCSDLERSSAFIAPSTVSVCFCCTGSSFGTMEIAPEGQAAAHLPQPMHFETSMMLFSVSVAPVGQTYRHRQSFVHRRIFLTA